MRRIIPLLCLALAACGEIRGAPFRGADTGQVRIGDTPPNFDADGVPALRVTQTRSDRSPSTPGGTNHSTILNLIVDAAHPAPNVAVIGTTRTAHRAGDVSGATMAIEGFIHAGGDGTAADLRAVAGVITMFDGLSATSAAALRAGINQNPAWTGTLTNAYGLYVSDIAIGEHRWAVYTAGSNPSHFGGPIYAPAVIVTSASGQRDLLAVIDSLRAQIEDLERRLADIS